MNSYARFCVDRSSPQKLDSTSNDFLLLLLIINSPFDRARLPPAAPLSPGRAYVWSISCFLNNLSELRIKSDLAIEASTKVSLTTPVMHFRSFFELQVGSSRPREAGFTGSRAAGAHAATGATATT